MIKDQKHYQKTTKDATMAYNMISILLKMSKYFDQNTFMVYKDFKIMAYEHHCIPNSLLVVSLFFNHDFDPFIGHHDISVKAP